ncbi:MAG: Rrf2 family transcriptional regulator [Candidatus Saganbacteria bacterium]|nr:Rrf2 family transcriptional regulator [Candidatus Saganbacteria bacterium]
MIELARLYNSGPVQIRDIAKAQKVPVRYLEQLLLLLKRRHLLTSWRGKEGGYSLAKHPSDVSVLEVIEVLDGQIDLAGKKMQKVPVLFDLFTGLQESLRQRLKQTTMEDLLFKSTQKTFTYNI